MFGNSKGYTTIESLWVVPVILILVISIVLLLALFFQYANGIINLHHDYLMGDKGGEINLNYKQHFISYNYKPPLFDSKDLQESIELLIYGLDKYQDAFKGYKDDSK